MRCWEKQIPRGHKTPARDDKVNSRSFDCAQAKLYSATHRRAHPGPGARTGFVGNGVGGRFRVQVGNNRFGSSEEMSARVLGVCVDEFEGNIASSGKFSSISLGTSIVPVQIATAKFTRLGDLPGLDNSRCVV